ncbi:hypothetical protein BDN72DRAFT_821909 [Pluteus cervinus]|uniref:Uncharacterized protein n=1 Tax=Pluteus cervinus TaxID=181527 RepID=A0ACD3AQ93_9AGAR|nr:hypothetical protein BDN72DRAFT_821909 [Pluteus cervinus]
MALDQTTLAPAFAGWSLNLHGVWDVLGPFPIHAREQHLLSPSFPVDITKPLDFNQTYPSSYADHGVVSWTQMPSGDDGSLVFTFPTIRWEALRATEGWAALQHHALLHSTLTVHPPLPGYALATENPTLQVELVQASYFTIIPKDTPGVVPKWYTGNIYAIESGLPHRVPLPVLPSLQEATEYDIFISADYEIRLFGDPRAQNSTDPEQNIRLRIELESHQLPVMYEPSQDVVCDFVDGVAFGNAFGIGVRSISGWWTADSVSLEELNSGLQLVLEQDVQIAPSQTRTVPFRVSQHKPFLGDVLNVKLLLVSGAKKSTIFVTLSINQLPHWSSLHQAIKASYFGLTMPTNFLTIPPRTQEISKTVSAVLALHGAGVDILSQPFWIEALPPQQHLWTVIPTGRTTWGLDWHGPSKQDAWDSVEALERILCTDTSWTAWKPQGEAPVILIGHSNGGQGAWHLAVHDPDRVAGVIAAAGYIKSQAYVSLTHSRSAHYIDPMLRAILETSLTPDDNDLYLSNLADIPILAIHGGDDDNVPVWHGREMVSALLYRGHDPSKVRFREDPHQGHWYQTVFEGDAIQTFFDNILTVPNTLPAKEGSFTLTISSPSDSGSKNGWKIEELLIPGRLGTLTVEYYASTDLPTKITSRNIAAFTITAAQSFNFMIDGRLVDVPFNPSGDLHFKRTGSVWAVSLGAELKLPPPTRLQAVLMSPSPITIIINDDEAISAALRVAHDLSTYHRLDCRILFASNARELDQPPFSSSNIVYIGSPNTTFVKTILGHERTPAKVSREGHAVIHGHLATGDGLGTLFIHPHPGSPQQVLLFMLAEDGNALERILRLFPLRTGVSLPAWVITSKEADLFAAAGVVGAGLWGRNWTWNTQVSWVDSPFVYES